MTIAICQASSPDPYRINGLVFEGDCDPSAGHVRWDTVRSLFNGGMLAAWIGVICS